MPRPRRSLPSTIRIKFNTVSGLYESTEAGITYQLTFPQMNSMKAFFRLGETEATVSAWYASLNAWERKKVKRLNAPPSRDEFFPDPSYD